MKILIVYATTEGQTRKIARHAADHLAGRGHMVELLPAPDAADTDLSRFDAAILAGSVHAGRYQKPLGVFAHDHAAGLNALRTLFVSVSLSAADPDSEDYAGLAECVARFVGPSGWQPGQVVQVAGAFRFSEYDFFKSWAMRMIAAKKDHKITPGQDHEYTDWDALNAVLDRFVAGPAG